MATVVEIDEIGRDGGYPIEQLTVYVYCDRCLSYNVRSRISLKTWVWIIVATLCATGVWPYIQDAAVPGFGVVCWPSFVLLVLGVVWGSRQHLAHKCTDCGNTDITYKNFADDATRDVKVPKAPKRASHRHYYIR